MRATTGDDLRVEKGIVNGIPFLFCSRQDDKSQPLVLLSHQFGKSKEMWGDRLTELAGLGYCAVALDNRAHGEREGVAFKSLVVVERKVDVCAVRTLIKETSDEIPGLIDHFLGQGGVDGARVGMVGVSMGGFITFRALVMDSRIKVAATVIASPYWDDTPEDMPVLTNPEAQQALRRYSMEHSPAQHMDRFYPRPLLIQIADDDVHFNQERVVEFHRELQPHYRETPDKLQLVVHAGVTHEFTPAMWENVKSWLQTHL